MATIAFIAIIIAFLLGFRSLHALLSLLGLMICCGLILNFWFDLYTSAVVSVVMVLLGCVFLGVIIGEKENEKKELKKQDNSQSNLA